MKPTIATGIILAAQALSVLSEESPSNESGGMDLTGRLSALLITPAKKHQQYRTGTKHRTSVGLNGRRRHRFGTKRLLTNRVPLPTNKKKNIIFCDPSSQEEDAADIGILSCGVGYECRRVEEEASSRLGGVCVPSTTTSSSSRDLQEENNEVCYVCPPGFTLGQAYYETIIMEDTESGYGGKTCASTMDPAYNGQFDASRCASVSAAVHAAGCCTPIL